ncbi:MAG: hypothetical protein NT120_05090 [Candidatus Aenigmarchaeota archaeon]|nr:hypothetical protein [Candidatus Aenigmarchaeota archaeon]
MAKKEKGWKQDVFEIFLAFAIAWFGYQAIGYAAGTSLPIVAVVSDSMYHTAEFDQWWNAKAGQYGELNITKGQFMSFPFRSGLSKGDLLIVVNQQPKIGDVIIYERFGGFTIVHRLVETNGQYVTRGDNNPVSDPPIGKPQVRGKVIFAVPLLGYPRLIVNKLIDKIHEISLI